MEKLTKAQDEALKSILKHSSKEEILTEHHKGWGNSKLYSLNDLDFDTLAKALYIGYEVHQTPEEKIKNFYDDFTTMIINREINEDYAKGVYKGVKKTLETFGIKVKGINE